VGAWIGALFHLITHAFFKAMLFLGSGQVIEGCHHEQDIRKMGGLRRKMPVTCWTFFVGVLAIAGFGIPKAHLGIGGYFSKDEILAVAYDRTYNWAAHGYGTEAGDDDGHAGPGHPHAGHASLGHLPVARLAADKPGDGGAHADHGPQANIAQSIGVLPKWMFWLPIIIAYITPFYMMRCWWLTFMGKPRDQQVHDHAHESSLMFGPLVVLAIGTVLFSYIWFRPQIADAGEAATSAALVVAIDGDTHAENMLALPHHSGHGLTDPHAALAMIVGFAWAVGMGVAVLIYRNGLGVAERLRRIWPLSWLHVALEQKLFFDHIYDTVLVGGTKWVLAQISRLVDTYIVDGIPNLLGKATVGIANFSGRIVDAGGVDGLIDGFGDTAQAAGAVVRQPQTGKIRNYILFGTAGASLVLIAIVIVAVMAG
jgi:NADH-quinone oxidoreductase subunit L